MKSFRHSLLTSSNSKKRRHLPTYSKNRRQISCLWDVPFNCIDIFKHFTSFIRMLQSNPQSQRWIRTSALIGTCLPQAALIDISGWMTTHIFGKRQSLCLILVLICVPFQHIIKRSGWYLHESWYFVKFSTTSFLVNLAC